MPGPFRSYCIRKATEKHRIFRMLDEPTRDRVFREAVRDERDWLFFLNYVALCCTLPFSAAVFAYIMLAIMSAGSERWARVFGVIAFSVTMGACVYACFWISAWLRISAIERRLSRYRCHRCAHLLEDAPEQSGWLICPVCGLDVPGASYDGERLWSGTCLRCRYDLEGTPEFDGWVTCPECGLEAPGPSYDGQAHSEAVGAST